jgi:hypothetical protein
MTEPTDPTSRFLRRVAAIDWHADPARFRSHAVLTREYLRRAAAWSDALRLPADDPPFRDFAELVCAEVRASPEAVAALPAGLRVPGPSPEAVQLLEWALHWSVVEPLPERRAFDLDDPFEPILLLCERGGGGFRIQHGFVTIGPVGVVLRHWRRRPMFPPTDLSPAALDALDGVAGAE